ncbi:MAG: cyclase family protein [Armatimonadetes bacterium]|nr:cyclase family protein [Armatimonadota bacterium]
MDVQLLSRVLQPGGLVWPGDPSLGVEQVYDLSRGDACNAFVLHLFGHYGTHVDGPRHFNPEGPTLAELPAETFLYRSVALIDLPCCDEQCIRPEDLQRALPKSWLYDLVMIRTGFGALRDAQPERYVHRSPYLSPESARMITDELPTVRALAVDTLSVGAVGHPEENCETHRILCGAGRQDGRFVLIYEDVRMDHLGTTPLRVWGLPLLVEGLDSAPVVMIAEL